MDVSPQLSGAHTTTSPCGELVASIISGKVRVSATPAPERFTEISIKIPAAKDVVSLRWNDDSDGLAVCSQRLIEVLDLHDDSHRIRLDNGSGGLGKFASADFIGPDHLLVTWEFGKAKLWDLGNGKSTDLSDIKTTCAGDKWQLRPVGKNASNKTGSLATLSRTGVDDVLQIHIPALQKTIASTKLPTLDAQGLSWSGDGRWLAVWDTPTASASVHFYTPDGHLFRSYPSTQDTSHHGLGIKSVWWSGNSQLVALTRFDSKIVLLNARTFTALAVIEHHTVIDQNAVSPEQQAPIWQESVSASSERSYTAVSQPFSPPLSRTKATLEPSELGVAEACFSSDGAYLATRDERMLNTVWIWDTASLNAHAVLVQHSNVRRMHWHPSRPDTLLLDCGEASAYLFNASTPLEPPTIFPISITGTPSLSWIPNATNAPSLILCATKTTFQILYPDGRPEPETNSDMNADATTLSNAEEGEDSLLEMLAGRTPLPPQSYTERVDIEVETEEGDSTTRMEDTFRGKQVWRRADNRGDSGGGGDPFDDSQIF